MNDGKGVHSEKHGFTSDIEIFHKRVVGIEYMPNHSERKFGAISK